MFSWSGQILLFQRFSDELEQRLRRRIIRQTEIVVELRVVDFLGSEDLGGNPCVLQHGSETLRLRGGVWMIGDMQDQERRYALALRHVCDGGEVAMLLRIVAELQAVPKLGHWHAMHAQPRLACLDDGCHVTVV